jgi:hypothetical protein
MYENANRIKALHQLKHAVQALLTAECNKNTYSIAYANAGLHASGRRRNGLRDKLDKACSEVAYFEHEAHCCAVEAGLALPEPARYNTPIYSYTAAGDQQYHGLRRAPTNLPQVPSTPLVPLSNPKRRADPGGWECM